MPGSEPRIALSLAPAVRRNPTCRPRFWREFQTALFNTDEHLIDPIAPPLDLPYATLRPVENDDVGLDISLATKVGQVERQAAPVRVIDRDEHSNGLGRSVVHGTRPIGRHTVGFRTFSRSPRSVRSSRGTPSVRPPPEEQ